MARRRTWFAAAAAVAILSAGTTIEMTQAATAVPSSTSAAAAEQAQLQGLYRQAMAQGGKLTVYMGGDKVGDWNAVAAAFTAEFPGVKLHLVTDLSKYQDARINLQIASHHQIADVAILQTTQDFTDWKNEGALLRYRPIGYNEIFNDAKDPDGYWTGVFYGAFADMVNPKDLTANPSAFTAEDLLEPRFKHKLIFTYPTDDDAVLYDFKLTVDKYGWGWVRKLMAQDPTFVRGTPASAAGVQSGRYLATLGTSGAPTADAAVVLPASDPFNTWVQHGAIVKNAPHPAAAKLFMSWITSRSFQQDYFATFTWSVRKDVSPPLGHRALATYPNTNPGNFTAFMSDRAAVEEFRSELELYVGPPAGPDPADPRNSLGVAPGAF